METKIIKLKDFEIGSDKLTILAGPCAAESMEILDETASGLKEITTRLGINFVFNKGGGEKRAQGKNSKMQSPFPGFFFAFPFCLFPSASCFFFPQAGKNVPQVSLFSF